MSITINLAPELEQGARRIADLQKRVEDFIRSQVELEQWRERRYSPEARALASEAMARAEQWRAQGVTRDEAFRRLREAHAEIVKHL